jgi:hypothetical protein
MGNTMARKYHLNLWVDPEVRASLEHCAKAMGVSLSAASRVLLRSALGLQASLEGSNAPVDAAAAVAYQTAAATVRRRVSQALRQIADEIVRGDLG